MSGPAPVDEEVERFARIAFEAWERSWCTKVHLLWDGLQPRAKEHWYAIARAVLAEPRGTLW